MVIAFVGQKGGAGKSTFAIFTAAELAERGQRVLLVDADPQGTARTWADVASESGHQVPSVIAMGATMHRPGQLDRVGASYDIVVIDCPPRHGDILRSALMIADVAVLPCGPSPADAWALATTLDLVSEAQVVRPQLRVCIAVTRIRAGTRIARSASQALGHSGLPVLQAQCAYRVAYQEALAAGQSLAAFAPNDAATQELRVFVDELLAFSTGAKSHAQAGSRDQAA